MHPQARVLLGNRRLVFSLSHGQATREDWDTFRRFTELAAEYGATHLHVGQFPFRYGSWVLPDNKDPYSAWSIHCTGLLRVCPPAALQPWVSLDHARWCQDFLHRQLEIMQPYGLHGMVSGVEPHWLPEGVFRAHPRWRGAQCELGRIALAPYFTPSIDEPEVIALYADAMREFATLFPPIDIFEYMSNDSGAGVAWTPCIYPGMNGPARHRRKDGGARVATWLNALKAAASEAGVDARINIFSSGFPPELRASIRAKLDSGVFLSGGNDRGETLFGAGASLGGGLWSPPYPVLDLADPKSFLAALPGIYQADAPAAARISVHEATFDFAGELLRHYLDDPGQGLLHTTRHLLDAAAWYTGSAEQAEGLIAVWEQIQRAIRTTLQIRQKGFGLVFNFCTVSMRWLLRPLVPRPDQLTEAESTWYQPFIFAAGEQKRDPHFGLVLGKAVFHGESVMWMARWCLQEAIDTLHGARDRLRAMVPGLTGDGARRVGLLAARTEALACLALNARNVLMYQYALDIAGQPQYGPNQMDYDDNIVYDQRALNLRKIAREEVDNIADLAPLLDTWGHEVLDFAYSADEENVFRLGPNLPADLRRKLDIMMDHWQDYETLYPSTKVHDFEPVPRGNLPTPE